MRHGLAKALLHLVRPAPSSQSGPTPHTPTLERVFANDSRRRGLAGRVRAGSGGCTPGLTSPMLAQGPGGARRARCRPVNCECPGPRRGAHSRRTHSWLTGAVRSPAAPPSRSAGAPEHPGHGRWMPVGPALGPMALSLEDRPDLTQGGAGSLQLAGPGDRRLLPLVGDQGTAGGAVAERRRAVGEAAAGGLGGAAAARSWPAHTPTPRPAPGGSAAERDPRDRRGGSPPHRRSRTAPLTARPRPAAAPGGPSRGRAGRAGRRRSRRPGRPSPRPRPRPARAGARAPWFPTRPRRGTRPGPGGHAGGPRPGRPAPGRRGRGPPRPACRSRRGRRRRPSCPGSYQLLQ